jgi:hypothetical protein
MRRSWTSPVQAHLERLPHLQRCPTIASVASDGPYATQGKSPKGFGRALSAGVNRRELPSPY